MGLFAQQYGRQILLSSITWHSDHKGENQSPLSRWAVRSRTGFYSLLAFYLPQLGVRGIFIEGDKCKALKSDNSLLRRGSRSHMIVIVPTLALFTKLLQIGAHPIHWEIVNGNLQKTGQFFIIWRAWQYCVLWRYMEVITSNIDLFCHDCYLAWMKSLLCPVRTIGSFSKKNKHWSMIIFINESITNSRPDIDPISNDTGGRS